MQYQRRALGFHKTTPSSGLLQLPISRRVRQRAELITVAALNDTSPSTLPLLTAAITDAELFTLGATRALRIRRTEADKGIPKRMCTEPIAFDVAMPPAPPQNLSVALGKISDEGTEASFIVDFRTSPDFGGRPITACSYAIELVELSVNGTIVTQKTVPALPDAEQTELVTKMKPNTDYVAVVRTQCKVDPPAQGESGVLRGASAMNRYLPRRAAPRVRKAVRRDGRLLHARQQALRSVPHRSGGGAVHPRSP